MYIPSSDEEALEIYRKLTLIRQAQEAIVREYPKDEIKTPVHLGIGLEGISVGVAHNLPPNTRSFGQLRNHGQYLAVTDEMDDYFGELYGRVTGTGGGKAGSMHLSHPEKGLISNSGIVAATISLAVGSGLAAKYTGTDQLTVCMFGDGAVDEGEFWESLNFACLHRLKVLFVCEDNDLAIYTDSSQRRGYEAIVNPVSGYNCHVLEGDGTDVLETIYVVKQALDKMDQDPKPAFVCLSWERIIDHVGILMDAEVGWREPPTSEHILSVDAVRKYKQYLQSRDIDLDVIEKIIEDNESRIQASILKAKAAPFPGEEHLYQGLFA